MNAQRITRTIAALALTALLSLPTLTATAQTYAPASATAYRYCATTHTDDFELTACRSTQDEAITEALRLSMVITPVPAVVSQVSVEYK